MALKRVTRCKDCANRAYDLGVGFTPITTMVCGMMGLEVEEDDGCTFGMKGDGGYVSREYDIDLSYNMSTNSIFEVEVFE